MSFLGIVSACTSDTGVPSYSGNPATRGYCGRPNEPFKNPIPNDVNPEEFEVVSELESGEYIADQVIVYYRESETREDSTTIVGVQNQVFLNNTTFVNQAFMKDCARDIFFDSEGQHEVVLPVRVKLNGSRDWQTVQAAKYSIEYNPKLSEGLVLKAELDESANPASDERDFVESLFIMTAKPAKVNEVFEPMSYEEFRKEYIASRFLSRFVQENIVNVTKEYKRYVKRAERRHQKLKALNEAPRDLYLQIQAQTDPKVYARIKLRKLVLAEEKN